jgi:hypothetical protein
MRIEFAVAATQLAPLVPFFGRFQYACGRTPTLKGENRAGVNGELWPKDGGFARQKDSRC